MSMVEDFVALLLDCGATEVDETTRVQRPTRSSPDVDKVPLEGSLILDHRFEFSATAPK